MQRKHDKLYDPVIKEIKPKDGIRGTIHNHTIKNLDDLTIPISKVNKSLKNMHQMISITYLTCLILNKS